MIKVGDKVVTIRLGKHTGSLTIGKHYTIKQIFHNVTHYVYRRNTPPDIGFEVLIQNDLGGLSRCDFNLFESYDEWLAKFREEQIKSVLDD